MYEFKLPDLGEGVHEGEVLKWHVEIGGTVNEDDPLVDVETDKAAITIPSPASGTVQQRNGKVGETIFVGDIVVVIDDGTGGEVAAVSEAKESAEVLVEAAAPAPAHVKEEGANGRGATQAASAPAASWGRVLAAPATRRLAREIGIDIQQVPPTGPAGRITPDDVRRFAEGGGQTPAEEEARGDDPRTFEPGSTSIPYLELEPMPEFEQFGPVDREPVRSIRRKVAKKMTTSMILAPHVAHMDEIDVTEIEILRRKERDRRAGQPGGKLTLLSFMLKAVTAALKSFPMFNASLDPFKEEIAYKKYYNLGIAVDTARGLMVPVIKGTDGKTIMDISADIELLAGKARDGSLDVDDLRGGTFTITNVGPLGGTGMIPTINYPEVAILGMGRVLEKPVVVDGEIVVRKMLPFTLAFDHRIADGAQAARFAHEIVRRLQDPTTLLLET